MREFQKAKELVESFLNHQRGEENIALAQLAAKECVKQIIEALKVTTGHCTLRRLDYQEVQMDFEFWEKVHSHIDSVGKS